MVWLLSSVVWAQTATPTWEPPPPPPGSPPAKPAPATPPPVPVYGHQAFSISIGAETAFDGDPATLRLSASGDSDLLASDKFAVALAMPITLLTRSEPGDTEGVTVRQTAIEFPPSLRLRLFPAGVVRPYGDLGLGVVVLLSRSSTDDGDHVFDSNEMSGFMTRAGFGLEIGPRGGGFMVVVEPLSTRTYYLNSTYGAIGAMVGAGARF